MRKYLFALFSVVMLIGCQSGEEDTEDTSTESDAATGESMEQTASSNEETTEETTTEESIEESTEENTSTEASGNTEEASSEETTETETSSDQSSDAEQVNVLATRCIISNLGNCEGIPLDAQKAEYERLLDEGVLGKREVTDTFVENVMGSHMTMHNQDKGPSIAEGQYPPSDITITAKYFEMELEDYYNGESEAALEYLVEETSLYGATVANKESGKFSDYKLYSAKAVESEDGEPIRGQIEKVYSHASSDGIERERVSYKLGGRRGSAEPGEIHLGEIESRELVETNIEYEPDIKEEYGPVSDASPHARECVIKFNIECDLDSVEEVKDAYDQYVANGTLPEATEAESYPAKIDASREEINYQMNRIEPVSAKSYNNHFKHYAYDLMQYYNGESEEVLHYLQPDSEAYESIVANNEGGDYENYENHLVSVDDRVFSETSEPPQEMILERVYSHATSDGERRNRALYQFELDEVSGIQIISYDELSDAPDEGTTEENAETSPEETTEEKASTEPPDHAEEAPTEKPTASASFREQADTKSEPDQVNVHATRCIISNLNDHCENVPLDDQKAAYQHLLDEGVFGKRDITVTFPENVMGSHMYMHNQNPEGPTDADHQPLSSADITARYFAMELEDYYNGENEAALEYLKADSPIYESTVENKQSGNYKDYKLYNVEVTDISPIEGMRAVQIERIYSHASSNGIERARTIYTRNQDGNSGPIERIQLETVESEELLEENMDYSEETAESYGPPNTASAHARECVLKFYNECEVDSIEEVRDAYDQYIENGTLPEATEANSYPSRIDKSRRNLGYTRRIVGGDSNRSYDNYLKNYAYDLMQYYNGESDDVLHYLQPDSEAYESIVANNESGDYRNHENHLVRVDRNNLSIHEMGPQEVLLERAYSHATSDGKRRSNVLYQLELDDASGIQIVSFEELSNVSFEE
ncbi:hypothetical protein ACFOLA_04405 [Salinicoccus hispanicus]|uniref:Uncharacterized protein n=1 Tax=Salinicoccus hispanicus TaxID=157225 RepID=A0A6N8U3Z4_9STAP|nr:hypothetical protein [Salinicoccus hispanicus]MXQ52057.1 hypothetical protein [Salinicoccus hispanicus]